MKITLMSALFFVSLSSQAQASDSFDYFSWCSNNKVMQLNQDGEVFERINCSDSNRVCKEFQKPVGRNVAVFAVCE